MKRVLFITHAGDPGGAEFMMIQLCKALRDSCAVLTFQQGLLQGILRSEGIAVSALSMSGAVGSTRKSGGMRAMLAAIPGTLALARGVLRESRKAGVVVCFSQKSFVVAALARPFMGKPIVWFLNDILSREHFSAALIRFLVGIARFGADHIVVNSRASLEAWTAAGGRATRVTVIYPGSDIAAIQSRVRHAGSAAARKAGFFPDSRPLIGMFGRISPWKGQHVFIRALAELPEVNAIIVGGSLFGAQSYEKEIRDLAETLGVAHRIAFLGHRDDVTALMAACDVVVHCSTAPEPFGLVIAEAMLVGRPVIAADAGGAREVVEAGRTGQLTAPGDSGALAAAVRRYLERPDWAMQMASAAQARAEREFSSEAMTRAFVRIVSEM